jgi:uncharacterized protein YndB with AHSA1/START domain
MTDQIQRELDLAAPVSVVWQAVTDADWLGQWLADEVELDLTPGGDARFVVDGETRHGWIEEVSAPARLSFWWQAADEPASRVTVELEPTGGDGTRVRITESRPLEVLDLVGIPLRGSGRAAGGGASTFGPALVAA